MTAALRAATAKPHQQRNIKQHWDFRSAGLHTSSFSKCSVEVSQLWVHPLLVLKGSHPISKVLLVTLILIRSEIAAIFTQRFSVLKPEAAKLPKLRCHLLRPAHNISSKLGL